MSKLKKLRGISKKPELAELLGFKPSFLTHALYIVKPEHQYTQFTIPKKTGGVRQINAPTGRLKSIQSSLAILLLDCLDEINSTKFQKPELTKKTEKLSKILKIKYANVQLKQPLLSHGFERQRSIITNAMMHLNKKNVLNIDLDNFFGSFNFGRVRGFFIKNDNFKLDENIATVIAQIACYENQLPQGSPCSPVITNLISHSLDIRLALLAKANSCTYSRYADDITFSSRKKIFPPAIVEFDNKNFFVGKKLNSEIKRAGFSINDKKTRIQFSDSRQDVTGLVVNKKPNTRKEYWRTVRAQCHSLFNTGCFTINSKGGKIEGNINQLEGQLNFIDQIDHYNRLRQKQPLDPNYEHKKTGKTKKHLLNGREKTFSSFLFYRLFHSALLPTILTEGKTDNLYLKSAINSLSNTLPRLCEAKTEKNSYKLLVNFLNYSSRTKFLLELSGGADYLAGFITSYENNFIRFKAPTNKHPVIIVVDNDAGPKEIVSRVLHMSSATIFPNHLNLKNQIREADFVHLTQNLYLVMTPQLPGKKDSDIEAFFTDVDRLRKHKGKCFNTMNDRDITKDLSKDAFANHIVSAQREKINFDGLKPLLKRIELAIGHYDSIKSTK